MDNRLIIPYFHTLTFKEYESLYNNKSGCAISPCIFGYQYKDSLLSIMDSFDLMLLMFTVFLIGIIVVSDIIISKLNKINSKINILKEIVDFNTKYEHTRATRKSKLEKHWRESLSNSLNRIFGFVNFKKEMGDNVPIVFEKNEDTELTKFDREALASDYKEKQDELEIKFKSLG